MIIFRETQYYVWYVFLSSLNLRSVPKSVASVSMGIGSYNMFINLIYLSERG